MKGIKKTMNNLQKDTLNNIYEQSLTAIRDNQFFANVGDRLTACAMVTSRDNLGNYYDIIYNQLNKINSLLTLYNDYMKPTTNYYFVDMVKNEFMYLRDLTWFIKEGKFDTLVERLNIVLKDNHKNIDFTYYRIATMLKKCGINQDKLMELSGKELYTVSELLF